MCGELTGHTLEEVALIRTPFSYQPATSWWWIDEREYVSGETLICRTHVRDVVWTRPHRARSHTERESARKRKRERLKGARRGERGGGGFVPLTWRVVSQQKPL